MEFHPIANIFPLMQGQEYEDLKSDIAEHGLIESIWTYDGKIVDGRNRYRACEELGIKPKFRAWNGNGSLTDFIFSENVKRRHMTPFQLACVAVDALPFYEEEAKERQRLSDGRGKKGTQKIADVNRGEAREQVAQVVGTNRQYVSDAKKLKQKDPDLFEKAKLGEVSGADARREMRRKEVVEELENIATKEAKKIEGVFDVVVVDPPWPMQKIERDERPNQSEFEYPTMELEEIAAVNIPCANDCHVWLWTTQKFLPNAFDVLKAWGLNYVCTFVWHKPGGYQPFDLPQYNCEFVLYARKGAPKFVDTKAFPTCFDAPRGKHSEKPDGFYEVVRRVTAGRRLDMFNRRKIEGFETWGNEA